jgi:uncharacterized protein (DUF2336 family)
VGLTAHDMSDMGRLAQLAMNPKDRASREEIYLAVASLYRIQGAELNSRERDLTREILRRLTRDVEMAVRIALAERLADDITAPHDLILLLVDDAIEVARPLILRSPLLSERDMLSVVAKAGEAHQEAVAGRSHITEPVTDMLVQSPSESVLVALVRNATAKISDAAYRTLVERSRALIGLQEPLLQRSDLPVELAHCMSAFVSDALKTYIQTNYKMTPKRIEAALTGATEVLNRMPGALSDAPADSAQKLIEKLAVSGQLKAGFLMRVLSQGQIDLFELAFAHMIDVDLARFRHMFYDGGVRIVALACRAGGIDKAAFPTVFNLSRKARHRTESLGRLQINEAEDVFGFYTRPTAMGELRTLAAEIRLPLPT